MEIYEGIEGKEKVTSQYMRDSKEKEGWDGKEGRKEWLVGQNCEQDIMAGRKE